MHATRRRLISVAAISVTLLAGSATASVAVTGGNDPARTLPAAAAPAAPAAAPVENLIVGYKSSASEASSNTAAADDAAAKGKKAGKKAKFDRRLGTGAALVTLGGALAPA
ncbi:protease, partial [Streptomyces lavendulae]